MKRLRLGKILVFFFLSFVPALEQSVGTKPDNRSLAQVISYAVLPDAEYPFTKVRTYPTPRFGVNALLRPALTSYYRLRLALVNPGCYQPPHWTERLKAYLCSHVGKATVTYTLPPNQLLAQRTVARYLMANRISRISDQSTNIQTINLIVYTLSTAIFKMLA